MSEHKFRVGDRVKILFGTAIGSVGTIIEDRARCGATDRWLVEVEQMRLGAMSSGFRGHYADSEIELVSRAEPAPAAGGDMSAPPPLPMTPAAGVVHLVNRALAEGFGFPDVLELTGDHEGVRRYILAGSSYDPATIHDELQSERQRASRLGDRAGKAEKDLAEWQSMFGDIKNREADLKSQLRSKDRQIAALRAKLLLLNRRV